ncbi:MAG: 3-deoxy-D-manno-octulosonic acid transferase [Planctomycetaceae bacterium]|jgi:3-deoxy-D-manno-octulosonic-acid transferase|nr:3-deoxy-D-manno-octulosonic acid transferase [Planctomycetaceae bacterium]
MITQYFFNTIYILTIIIVSPVLFFRALRYGKYRRGFRQKWLGRSPRRADVASGSQRLWFHAVSVGEVKLLQPLLTAIRSSHPEWECVISTTSNTGMELAAKLYGDHYTIFFCPLDFSWAVRKALSRIKPTMLLLTEQELWPNLINIASSRGVKLVLINGRFSDKGYKRYRYIRFLIRPLLQLFDCVAVQSETYAGWYHQLGAPADRIFVTGSMKFDGANTDRENKSTRLLRQLAGITDSDVVFLAGSTQEPEEMMAVDCYEHLKHTFPSLRLILVPRHPERFDKVAYQLTERGVLWERRSRLTDYDNSGGKDNDNKSGIHLSDSTNVTVRPRILLVDTIGELGAWWGTSHIAFVGGSINTRGGQNMIEPAAYGAAVCFGPNTKNFRDIVALILRNEAAAVVNDQRGMETFVQRCLEDTNYRNTLGQNGIKLVEQHAGATGRTLELIERIVR